jgi:hypothetical protein
MPTTQAKVKRVDHFVKRLYYGGLIVLVGLLLLLIATVVIAVQARNASLANAKRLNCFAAYFSELQPPQCDDYRAELGRDGFLPEVP